MNSLLAGLAGWIATVAMAATGVSDNAVAQVAAQHLDARQVLSESNQRHRPRSEEYLGEVIVISKDGKERRKEWRSYRDGPIGSSDRLIRFLSPPDVRGVGYLAHHRPGADPDEWLYLPSMKRERRISVKDRDAAFVGTSFSYEDLDLLEFDPARYDASLLPPETIDGQSVYVIALVPRTSSAYTKKVLRLREDTLSLLSVEFFSRDVAGPVKQLRLFDYSMVDGYLVAMRIEMTDLRKSSRTIVALHEVKLDRPQPPDRYTLQNLLREEHDDSAPASSLLIDSASASSLLPDSAPTSSFDSAGQVGGAGGATMRLRPSAFEGQIDARLFGSWGAPAGTSSNWQWATALLRMTPALGSARIDASVRVEESSSPQVGPVVADLADRRSLRAPLSVRTLSIAIPLGKGLDLEAGRFQVAWGETDGYSPADAFLPRDLSDPLTEERLPLWGAHLRGEQHGVRFEVLAVPVLTPWRLPDLDGRHLPFPGEDVTLVESPWTVPTPGFGAARVMGTIGHWDVSAWGRFGERPAPVLVPDLPATLVPNASILVPLDRHFTTESAVGGSLSHTWGGWVVNGELGFSSSPDPAVREAAIWTIGGSRIVGNGVFTATVAANAIATPADPLLMFDRALLPAVILATHQYEPWGSWRAVWVGTFHTVGGVLSAEVTRSLTETVGVTLGADLPHGAVLSPATAFTGGKRVRAAIDWAW